MKTRILIREGEYRLAKAGCMEAKADAQELYCFLMGIDRLQVFMKAEEEADEEVERKYLALIARRAERIPLQYITGVQEFMGHRFRVDQSVLIPRQDTETLVLEAAKTVQNNSRQKLSLIERLRGGKEWELLDLCCGSGAVGISMAKICDNIQLTGTDISGAAVAMAETNAKSLRVKAEFLVGDLFEPVKGRKFDMIVSNPPYIKTNMIAVLQEEIKNYEPREALDGGRDGLDYYRRIIKEAPEYL
ncbi:MAG: peptide chain release factor N(5)-glutamine methyltransferase, partial [Firmicutes bacterium]|nr:peptide chain release factor N(5)-glutamine methyltransferase [Bacillota bacterium]